SNNDIVDSNIVNPLPADVEDKEPDTIMSKTKDADLMEKPNSVLYKTAIESIPLLTQENFSMWHSRVVNLLDLLKIKTAVFSENTILTSSEELVLCTVLAAKIDATIHSNVINHTNKEDGMLIWKLINNYFASTQSANCARVWNNFSMLNYDNLDVNGFITRTRAAIEKMHKKFPKTPELNSISSAITHSGQEMTPDLPTSQQVSLFTDYNSTKCKPNAHNTRAPHPQHSEQSVRSFYSSISHPSMNFVLDSGSSAHMISNLNLFFSIDIKEEGIGRSNSPIRTEIFFFTKFYMFPTSV
ncbi:hypothetical protein VP01_7119g1, partial [Puccinia sorghi]